MTDFIYRANIDHCLEMLDEHDLLSEKRAMIVKLLIEQENKLARYQEQLEFTESRAANGQDRLNGVRRKIDGIALSAVHRPAAERLVANYEALQKLLDAFCHQLRAKVTNAPL